MRGRKAFLKEPVPVTIILERSQKEGLEAEGKELSSFFRECAEEHFKQMQSPYEQLLFEQEADKSEIEEINLRMHVREEKLKELLEKKEKELTEHKEKNEIIRIREEYFEKNCRKLIKFQQICDVDFYQKAKMVCKFESKEEMFEFFENSYKAINDDGKTYANQKIRTFLRLDTEKLQHII